MTHTSSVYCLWSRVASWKMAERVFEPFSYCPTSIMFFNCFTVGFHTNLKDLLTAKNSLRLLYNKLLIVWNMHCICFVLSLCSLVTTVSPLVVIDFILTLKGLRTCQALPEYVLACTEICFSWFTCKSLDAYCLFCFTFNYLCIITWYNHIFYIASSNKQLDCIELNTYDSAIMIAYAKKKNHGVTTAASKAGTQDEAEVQSSMGTIW